jgi:hypothetical protein
MVSAAGKPVEGQRDAANCDPVLGQNVGAGVGITRQEIEDVAGPMTGQTART